MCNGTGYVKEASNSMDYPYVKKCPKCKGSGYKVEQEQTNEEWLCRLDTEDKAREISDMTAQGYWSEELVEKWLKKPHRESE